MKINLLAGASMAILLSATSAMAIDVTEDTALESATVFEAGDILNVSNGATYGFIGDDSYDLTFKEESVANVSSDGTGGGIANSGKLNIEGGNINASGTGEHGWNTGAQVAGYAGVNMTGGNVTLKDNAILYSGGTSDDGSNWFTDGVNIKGGIVNLEGNGATIFAASNTALANGGYEGAINVTDEGSVVVANGANANLVSTEINIKDGGKLTNNGTINVSKDKKDAKDGTLSVGDKGELNLNNGTINADAVELSGTFSGDSAEEKIANAPKLNVNGDSTINATVGLDNALLTVNKGAKLTSGDITMANNSYADIYGNLNADVVGEGNISIKDSQAQVKYINGADINLAIDANTSSSQVVAEDSTVKQIYVSNGNSFTIDDADKLATDDLVSYGTINLATDYASAKTKIGENGSLNLASHKLTGDTTLWKNSNLMLNIDKTASGDIDQVGGQIDGDIELVQSANLKPIVAIDAGSGTYQFATGEVTLSPSKDGDSVWNVFNNNMLYDVALAEDSNNTLDVTKKDSAAVAQAVSAAGGNANHAATVNAWVGGNSDAASLSGNARNMAEHLNVLAQSNPNALVNATAALAPETNATVQSASTENANQVFSAVGSRLSGGSVASASQGKASGDMMENAAVWAQGLFNKSKLDDTSKAKGFDADSTGIAFGAEKFINDDVKLGVGYAYTNTDIDGFMRSTDVDTHTAIAYGEYKPSQWFVNGIATYGWSSYDENKDVAGMGVKSKYDVDTFGLQAMTGYDLQVSDMTLTPEAGLRYVNIAQDAYTDSADQHVGANSSDILTGVIGAKIKKDIALSNGMNIRPEARIAATYDLVNDDANSVVTLANGSAYQVNGEALDKFGMEFGAGLTSDINDQLEVALGYEGKFRSDYSDHTGLVNAKYKF